MLTPTEVALEFVKRINAHNPDKLAELMAENHVFIDSIGARFQGREAMRENWKAYFAMFPDYHIVLTDVFQQGRIVALFGTASGTFAVNGQLAPENRWEGPAAWKATTQADTLSEWQVYADNELVRKIIDGAQG
jgi:ketosteroid isomerase-like protein